MSLFLYQFSSLQKHAYSNILKMLVPKKKIFFQIKNDIFTFLLKTYIVDSIQNRLGEAVQKSTHNLYF